MEEGERKGGEKNTEKIYKQTTTNPHFVLPKRISGARYQRVAM